MTLDFGRFEALTFDCYGTLIDWESGILAALREPLAGAPNPPSDDARLEAFGRAESAIEARPYRPYRDILGEVLRRLGVEFGAPISDDQAAAFGASVGDWPAFPDSAAALDLLHGRFKLGVITNCDDDLFAQSAKRLETRVRLGRDRPAGGQLQAGRAEFPPGVRADRVAPRANPPRRPEPVP